jgi:hypothetical protein
MVKRRAISKLSFKQASLICREFIPIGDALVLHFDSLISANYSAFFPYYQFEQSFCTTEEDIDIHIKCMTEEAKLTLGRPWPLSLRVSPEDRQYIFTSVYIDELCKKRDLANGVPVSQLALVYPGELWRAEIDPCKYKMVYARIWNKKSFDEQWAAVRDEQRRRIESEVARHSTGLAGGYKFGEKKDRHQFFKIVMDRNAPLFGFEYDKSKSGAYRAIFTKQINGAWDLCWVIEELRQFCFSPTEGNFELSLEVRGRHLNGTVDNAEPGTFLIIRFQNIIPGFLRSYWKFNSFDELETIIKAHLCLYSLFAFVIESGLRRTLGNESCTRT